MNKLAYAVLSVGMGFYSVYYYHETGKKDEIALLICFLAAVATFLKN